jgi:hypothetical protein
VQRVLGVIPAQPGFASAAIEPALGGLEWVAGTVPTPHGPIEMRADAAKISVISPVPFWHSGAWYEAGRHEIEIPGDPSLPNEHEEP